MLQQGVAKHKVSSDPDDVDMSTDLDFGREGESLMGKQDLHISSTQGKNEMLHK